MQECDFIIRPWIKSKKKTHFNCIRLIMGKEYLKCIKNHFPKTCLLPTVRFLAHVLVQIVEDDTISIIYRKASGDYVSYDQTQCQ